MMDRWPARSEPHVVMIGLGLIVPVVAVLGYLAITVFYLVPIRSLRHRT